MDENIIFVLGDKLATYYEAGIAIFSVCVKAKSPKMKAYIRAYVNALINIWTKAFGNEHIMSIGTRPCHHQRLLLPLANDSFSQMSRSVAGYSSSILWFYGPCRSRSVSV